MPARSESSFPLSGATAALMLTLGCGPTIGPTSNDGEATEDATSGRTTTGSETTTSESTASTSGGISTTGPMETGESTGVGSDCTETVAALAASVTHDNGGCSVLVRLDHDTLDILGYHAFCSAYLDTVLDEQAARDLTDCCSELGTRLNPPGDESLWVFHREPLDFGTVAIVTNHIVARIFEATIIWAGTGDIGFPSQWAAAEDLGGGCPRQDLPDVVSYDLHQTGEIDSSRLTEILDVVEATALAAAMQTNGGTVYRTAVILYPRTEGVFDPGTAEYIVIVEGGV